MLIGPGRIDVATCCDENQISRQEVDVVLVSSIEASLLAPVWECDGGGTVVVFFLVFLRSISRGLYSCVVAHLALHFD